MIAQALQKDVTSMQQMFSTRCDKLRCGVEASLARVAQLY